MPKGIAGPGNELVEPCVPASVWTYWAGSVTRGAAAIADGISTRAGAASATAAMLERTRRLLRPFLRELVGVICPDLLSWDAATSNVGEMEL
jgi:hypothetical protein